jgi:uncharacterized protein
MNVKGGNFMLRAIASKIDILDNNNNIALEYHNHVKKLIDNPLVLQMKLYTQHGSTTCYQHCINVSYYSYRLCKILRLLKFDVQSVARAGLLHDFFLYDWHTRKREKGTRMHGFIHSQIALENAKRHFELNDCECDIILKHMFPLNIKPPKYRESLIVICVDKYCAVLETGHSVAIAFSNLFKRRKANEMV